MRLWVFAAMATASVAIFAQTNQNTPWYLSGQVMMEDGAAPPDSVVIQSVCNGIAYRVAVTDSRGLFNFRVGGADNASLQDASVGRTNPQFGRMESALSGPGSATSTADPITSQNSTQQQSGATDSQQTTVTTSGIMRFPTTERTLDSCELRATLPGFSTASVSLVNRKPMDGAAIGTLILHRIESIEGRTVSVTTLAAPKAARAAYGEGRKAAARGELEKARAQFEKAVALYPQFAPAWAELGQLQAKQKQLESAARSYQNAIQADPKYVQSYLGLAFVELSQKEWDKLTGTAEQALRLDPFDYPQAYCLHAIGDYNNNRMEAAEKSARQAEKIDVERQWPQSWRVLGLILTARHEFAGAAAQLREYLRLAPRASDVAQVQKELARAEELGGGSPQ